MENKYYTPTSQEEVISWLFSEAWIRGVTTDPDKNIKIVFDKEQISTNLVWLKTLLDSQNIEKDSKGNVLKMSINLKCLRIKYLDKSDIESLGFEFRVAIDDIDIYFLHGYKDIIEAITLEYNTKNKTLTIANNAMYFEDYICLLKDASIKNISELKKVLTMLGIK